MPTLTAHTIFVARRLRTRASEEAGLTLIEVLVTALIIALIASATAVSLISVTHATGDQQLRSQANAIVTQDQERLRGLTDEQLANLGAAGSSRAVQVNGTSFQVTSTAQFQDAQGNSSCTSSSVDFYKTTSTVSWNENYHAAAAQTQTVSAQSLLGRPVIGDLAAAVSDQTGTGLSGVTVTATPPSGVSGQSAETSITDATGCTFMTGLAPATYALSIGETGYVDTSGASPTTSSSATVGTTGTPTTSSDVLGLAGTVNATFSTFNSSGGEADGISYTGAGNTLSSPAPLTAPSSPPVAALSSFAASNLFPFNASYGKGSPSYANNWTVYAGRCSFQEPPPSGQTKYTVGPGQTASVPTSLATGAPSGATGIEEPSLYLPTIRAKFPGSSSYQYPLPSDIVLTYSSGGCTDQYAATVASPQSGSGTSATAPTNGWLANPGQPYAPVGDLTVCADYQYTSGRTTTWYTGSASAANALMTATNSVPTITLTSGSQCAGAS